MYLTWASFNNLRMLLMACMPVVIFYLIWLINTSEDIRSEEGTLLDLVCWPDGNAIPVIIACGSFIAVIIELYGLYQLFKAGLPKKDYNVTNGLFYYIWALIVIIIIFLAIMFYSGLQSTIIRVPSSGLAVKQSKQLLKAYHGSGGTIDPILKIYTGKIDSAKIKGGITNAMLRYVSHLPSKVAIDRLQTRFHCCGRVNYQEWFYIPWYTTGGNENFKLLKMHNHKFVGDSVPYSCCSMEALQPCVHHGISHPGLIYKYDPAKQLTIWKDGCEEKLITEMMAVSWRFNAVMALIIAGMIFQGMAVRYLHTAYRNGLNISHQVPCEAYLLRALAESESQQFNVPKKKPVRRKKFRQARTLQWVTATYRPRRIAYTTSSASDVNSSDELLKPIYE